MAANLTFGCSNRPEFAPGRLVENEYFLGLLQEARIKNPLMALGLHLVDQLADLMGHLPSDSIFFRESPVLPDEFEHLKEILHDLKRCSLREIPEEEQHRLLVVALRFIPGLHKTVAFPKDLEEMLLEARTFFMDRISTDMPNAMTFYHASEYIHSESILENILYGKRRVDRPAAQERINQCVIHLLIEEDLLERIVEIGLNFNVGVRGDRLSGGQRQEAGPFQGVSQETSRTHPG